jgi:5,10-methylene-tetrahydrofolate dehydrogenase/methenyl tetrahydrofolate cyclohydrolase
VVGQIWDGGNVAQELLENVRMEVVRLQHEGRPPPTLAEIRVGEMPSDERRQMLHADACRKVGVSYQVYAFPPHCTHQAILQTLADLNTDSTVSGITIDAHCTWGASSPTSAYGAILGVQISCSCSSAQG